ncbi:MAG: GAF domain-containing sensor histidine kinase [Desulfobacterales bacterium]|nr:GAF domain-containing sensor histidine kinase [Desulfobacterales bacterium]
MQTQESRADVTTKAIYDISKAIAGRFQLEDLLNETVTTLARIIHADACSVFLIDKDNKLRIKAGEGYSRRLVGIAEYELGEGVTGTIAKEGETFRTTKKEIHQDNPDWRGKYDHIQYPDGKGKCVSFLGVPLKVKDKIVGVLKVENKREEGGGFAEAYTKQDEELMEILANTIAVATENVRLIEEQRKNQNLRIAESIHKVSEGVVGTFELSEILQRIVESFKEISNATACSIFLVDEDKRHIRMKAGVGYDKDLRDEAEYNITVNPDTPKIGITAWIVLTKQKLSVRTREELTNHPAWKGKYDGQQYKGDEKCKSFISLPLLIRDEVIGVLKAENKIVDNAHPEPYFTPEEEQVFEILANIAAIVVRNATLITEEEKRRRDLIINVYQIGSKLQEQDDIDRLIYIFLMGLTNEKAIGFNCAMYFDYLPVTKQLIGRMAIGPVNKKEEGKSDSLSIRSFDNGRIIINTELNRIISNAVIDLEKGDFISELATRGKKFLNEYKISSFSINLKDFLERIESEKVVLIGIAASKGKYSIIFCDNTYNQKLFDQRTKELLLGFIGQMSKALERVHSTEEVKAAKEAAWQEVSAMAAHRLGNILPFTENRIKDALKACGKRNLQNLLLSCQEDMRTAINVLSDFKMFATVGRINLTSVDDVNNTLKRIVTMLKDDFKDINIHTSYLKRNIIPRIRIDFDNIKIVFSSLLVNTMDAKSKNHNVDILVEIPSDSELEKCGLRPKGNYIKFVYKDNGPGISDEDKEKIFEAFHTNKPGNSGLGLAIVRRSIEQHGGAIFEDGKCNQGVRFNILFPLIV